MSSIDHAIRTTKMNRAMTHRPHYYDSLKKYQRKAVFHKPDYTEEEKKNIEIRMAKAKRKSIVRELRFYVILMSTIVGVIYKLLF